ncbi:MAG: hypothetical protein OXH06_05835 [Gemmatimonadetes bacterium]|nr:hypothetical protein [Gemmatimonadota bacterium]
MQAPTGYDGERTGAVRSTTGVLSSHTLFFWDDTDGNDPDSWDRRGLREADRQAEIKRYRSGC